MHHQRAKQTERGTRWLPTKRSRTGSLELPNPNTGTEAPVKTGHCMGYEFTVASIAPVIGTILTITRSAIPLRDVLLELNPTPFAAMILNHTGWVVYSVLHTDWFIFTSESTGLMCGIWITFSLFPLANATVQNRLNGLVLVAGFLYCGLALVSMVLNSVSPATTPLMWSWAVSITQVLLFAAPLSTLYKAVKARSSASMHLGMGILGFLGSAMWTVYGGTISNLFILIPNLLGALLTLTALAICVLFPRRQSGAPSTPAAHAQQRMTNIERQLELQIA